MLTSRYHRKICFSIGKIFIIFGVGFYAFLTFASRGFPYIQGKLNDVFCSSGTADSTEVSTSRSENNIHCDSAEHHAVDTTVKSFCDSENPKHRPEFVVAGEILTIAFVFSIAMPVYTKLLLAYARHSQNMIDLFWDPVGDSQDVYRLERLGFGANFALDLLRYAYGRGIMFRVSNFYLFLFLLFKDVVYQFWYNYDNNFSLCCWPWGYWIACYLIKNFCIDIDLFVIMKSFE